MADECRRSRALTIVTRVVRGREEALRLALDRLPTGGQSPLARLPGTHFGRWVVVPGIDAGDHLLFSTTYDAGPADYLGEICARMPEEADAVWSHCEDYPGAGDRDAFVHYMKRHRVTTNLFVAAYPEATLEEIQEALEMHRRLVDFVPRAQAMSPAELQAAFEEERLADG